MISAKELSDEQKSAMQQWAADGAQLPEFQQRLKGQFGLNVTYMDTRFLVLDLGIELQSEVAPEPEVDVEAEAEASSEGTAPDSPSEESPSPMDADQAAPTGGLQVAADEIPRPGSLVSGTVTFSDGEKAVWMIDEMGRPALDPDTPDYQPTEADLLEFEKYLRALLEG